MRASSARRAALMAAALVAATSATPALAIAQRAATSRPVADSVVRLARADSAYAAGNGERAEREYAALVAANPGQSRAVFRLAQLREKRDATQAVELYRRYVALQPRDPWGYTALADALGASGDLRGALATYEHALRIAPGERDVRLGQARLLARAGRTDAAIAAYEQWLTRAPRDAEALRELAAQRRKAGRHDEAVAALEQVRALDARPGAAKEIDRDIVRARAPGRGTIEPLVSGSGDSDGLTTARAGAIVTSPLIGRVRVLAALSTARASDGTSSRNAQKATLGLQYRPLAQLRLELDAGLARADRSLIDTRIVALPPANSGRQRPRIGRPTVVGVSNVETLPVGRARLAWRQPGDGVAIDARVGRQLLDASPFLVAQAVQRDEASLSVDMRLAGPMRARAFGRVGNVHNETEDNGRRILGAALAYAPGSYEMTVRAQSMTYDKATTLAYFAPRDVRTVELTTYLERETEGGTTVAIDLGGGGQRVADWTTAAGTWSPSFRAWGQAVMPLGTSLSLGTEVEAYDSRVGTDAPALALTASQWRYASANIWLRVAF